MEKDKYYKILDEVVDKWNKGTLSYTNCANARPKDGVFGTNHIEPERGGYPVVIKWRDVVKDCELCGDLVVNQSITITLEQAGVKKKCHTCGYTCHVPKRSKR
jgi:hypothetical protein